MTVERPIAPELVPVVVLPMALVVRTGLWAGPANNGSIPVALPVGPARTSDGSRQ